MVRNLDSTAFAVAVAVAVAVALVRSPSQGCPIFAVALALQKEH